LRAAGRRNRLVPWLDNAARARSGAPLCRVAAIG
jgi:hypothetical protein